jgi:hypothetical protein
VSVELLSDAEEIWAIDPNDPSRSEALFAEPKATFRDPAAGPRLAREVRVIVSPAERERLIDLVRQAKSGELLDAYFAMVQEVPCFPA